MIDKYSALYSENITNMKASAIREICKLIAKPEIISLAGGWPSPATFPVEEARQILTNLLENNSKYALQYSASEGLPKFRDYISQWTKNNEQINTTADNILITSGSTQGMDLAGKVLINPDDIVLVGLPTYFTGAFSIYGCQVEGIPLDKHGMRIDLLEAKIRLLTQKRKKIKFVYIQPNFQNPTGVTLTLERRKKIIELANELNFLIVEDNPYGDLRFEGECLPPIKAMDHSERVIYLRSFSKVFSPGIRLAWIAGEKDIIRKMVIAKQYIDACSNTLSQYLLYEFCNQGYLELQIKKNSRFYKHKRDFMLKALNKYFPKEAYWNKPAGGFFIFITLPQFINAKEILHKAINNNVAFVIGQPFFVDNSGHNTMRLSYSQSSEEEIEKAIRILGKLISNSIEHNM